MKKILLEKLLDNCKEQEYQKQYEYIINLLEEKKIKPVKASRLNGKSPALYREYWLLEETKDYSNFIEELRYQIIPDISVDYYLRHLESYEADREWVLQLNKYLKERKEQPRELILKIVDKIEIHQDKTVDLYFKLKQLE